MSTLVTASELAALQNSAAAPTLVDVRLPEDYAAAHLPGAVPLCVFEVSFLEELKAKNFPKDQPIYVYGTAEDSHEARMAAEKLEREGFTQVFEFRGGLDAWSQSGGAVESSGDAPEEPSIADGRHELDLKESTVTWIGRNLINKHWGHVPVSSGCVVLRDGLPVSGEAMLDLRRITCSDLAGDALHDVLIHHLESDDFFDVARFPAALFSFTRAERCSDKPGCRNLTLHGKLTLRGITKPLVIEATAGVTPEGKAALQAGLVINRTDWGVLYGSGNFFRRLAGHLVNDQIELQLRVLTV